PLLVPYTTLFRSRLHPHHQDGSTMVMTNSPGAAAPVPLEVDETPAPAASSSRRRRTLLKRLRRSPMLYLMLVPGIVYFAVFKYAPMYGITIAFQDYLPFLGMKDSP